MKQHSLEDVLSGDINLSSNTPKTIAMTGIEPILMTGVNKVVCLIKVEILLHLLVGELSY